MQGLHEKAILISHLEDCEDDGTINKLLEKHIVTIGMERIPRISRAQSMDALSSQSNIAGYRAVIEAAVHYTRFLPLMMTSAGSAKPARLVVLGAGVAGLQAIATAKRLGAIVHAFDVRSATREQIESLGAKFVDTGVSAEGSGGYARELTDEEKQQQQDVLDQHIMAADAVITTAAIPGRAAPKIIRKEVVEQITQRGWDEVL